MVEVDHTSNGLARLSIVNYNGHVLIDTFVKPKGKITNFRSWISGVYPQSMKNAMPYDEARDRAIEIMSGRVIVGHSLKHDFKVINWEPLQGNVRDLATYKKYLDDNNHVKSLKRLTNEFLGKEIQTGSHNSVVDARSALCLYRIVENSWTQQVRSKQSKLKRAKIEADVNIFGQKHKRKRRTEEKE